MSTRVVVADESEARFYEYDRASHSFQLVERLADPKARLHDRALTSDRPGRTFDRAPLHSGRRGATAHHGLGADKHPHEQEMQLFAHQIALALERSQQRSPCERLVLAAAPRFLGLLRPALSSSLHARIVAEIHKDLLHEPEAALQSRLMHQALGPPGAR